MFDHSTVKLILDKVGRDSRAATQTLPTLSFEELKELLTPGEYKVIDRLLGLVPAELGFLGPFIDINEPPNNLYRVSGQQLVINGYVHLISDQYLPLPVWQSFDKMRQALFAETKLKLFIESGYRSPAFQAITFLTYLERFNYDLELVASVVALPGYSQHGDPDHTALDLMNQVGVPSDEAPQLFSNTQEYEWLLNHAHEFGFKLSYPENNQLGVKFEPWHWQFNK